MRTVSWQVVIENAVRRIMFPGLIVAIVGMLWMLASYRSFSAEQNRRAANLALPPVLVTHEGAPGPDMPVWLVMAETSSDSNADPT